MEKEFLHPELMVREILFTNANTFQFEKIDFKTKRKGKMAYDGRGNLTGQGKDWFPVFINKKELLNIDLGDIRRKFREANSTTFS